MNELVELWFVTALSGLAGLTITGWTTYTLVRALESRNWPSTEGEVLASAVIVADDRRFSNTSATYGTVVHYRYTVDSIGYTSKRLSFNSQIRTSLRSLAEDEALYYQPGMKVQVYYDPAKPEEAVLKTGADLRLYILLLTGFVFLGVSLAISITLLEY